MKSTILTSFIVFFSLCCISQVTDINGKTYKTTLIGSQTWMSENLDVDKFQNGDPIPQVQNMEEFTKACQKEKPAWCYYENRKIQDDPINGQKYGKLYNWYAINDKRGLAPKGWSIPTDDDWTILANFLGGKSFAANFLKTNESWGNKSYFRNNGSTFDLNCGGENSYSFNALPGGCKIYNGINLYFGETGFWWTSSGLQETNNNNMNSKAVSYQMKNCEAYDPDRNKTHDELFRTVESKRSFYSVRCIKQ
jgi:uncharacterized protein (TIGR02145 family)